MVETLLAEQPLIVSVMLGALSAGLLFGWLQTGKTAGCVAGLIMALSDSSGLDRGLAMGNRSRTD